MLTGPLGSILPSAHEQQKTSEILAEQRELYFSASSVANCEYDTKL